MLQSISVLPLSQDVNEIQIWALHSLDQAGGYQDTVDQKTTDFIYDTQKNNFQFEVELMSPTFEIKPWQTFVVLHD